MRAYAKINLYLRVVGKRPDGYHELETLFERITLADELTFEPHPTQLVLTCNLPELSCGEDNLILKAARLLQKEAGIKQGAKIHLTKRIPIAAGLGGGSSDAATALIGLSRLWSLNLTQQSLIALGAQLGSDVAFFLYSTAYAVGTGRGEICQPVPADLKLAHVLVVPNTPLSTPEIFKGSRFDLTAPRPSIKITQHALSNGSLSELASGLYNDLEPEAIRRCPVIGTIQTTLTQLGCLATRMSGSGPSVFGLCRNLEQAKQIAHTLRQQITQPWLIDIVETAKPY